MVLQPQHWVLPSSNELEVHSGFTQPLISDSGCERLLQNETAYALELQASGEMVFVLKLENPV